MDAAGPTLPVLCSPQVRVRGTQQREHAHSESSASATNDHRPSPRKGSQERRSRCAVTSSKPSPPATPTAGVTPRAPAERSVHPSTPRCQDAGEHLKAPAGRQPYCGGALPLAVPPEELCTVEPVGDVVAAPLWTDFALAAMGPWRAAAGRAGPAAGFPPSRRWATWSPPRRSNFGADRRSGSGRTDSGRFLKWHLRSPTPQRAPSASRRLNSSADFKTATCTMDLLAEGDGSSSALRAEDTTLVKKEPEYSLEESRGKDTSHSELVSILLTESSFSHSSTSNGCTHTHELQNYSDGSVDRTQRSGSGPDGISLSLRKRIVSFQ
ncbi:hypothetical protein STCU_09923 [Strigomonas culicis]|uniref:Uncharacterized protein n=1 Tax=Strigomonas culicis TaxID=28005 RepID=S9TPN0_9TRYP|nr:hypothetical protein STCU_09923 [Strigomonas culicis]|eukprot:EPY18418.1 hypothetical protein STCU_09923 [Strigomonas culicis]